MKKVNKNYLSDCMLSLNGKAKEIHSTENDKNMPWNTIEKIK